MASAFNLKSALNNGVAYLEDVYGGAAIIMALTTTAIIGGLSFGAEVGDWELAKRPQLDAVDAAFSAAAGGRAPSRSTAFRIRRTSMRRYCKTPVNGEHHALKHDVWRIVFQENNHHL